MKLKNTSLPSHSPIVRNSSVRKKFAMDGLSTGSSYCPTKLNRLIEIFFRWVRARLVCRLAGTNQPMRRRPQYILYRGNQHSNVFRRHPVYTRSLSRYFQFRHIVERKYDNRGVRRKSGNLSGQFNAVHTRHYPVLYNYVRLQLHALFRVSSPVLASPQTSHPACCCSKTRKIPRVPS